MKNSLEKKIVETIGIIASILTIIGFIFQYCYVDQIIINLNFLFGNLGKWLLGLSLCVSIFSVLYLLYITKIYNLRKDKLMQKYNEIISHFQKIILNNKPLDYKVVSDKIIEMYSYIHKERINISFKMIDNNQMVYDIYSTRENTKYQKQHINDCTDFLSIIKGNKSFHFNIKHFLKNKSFYNSKSNWKSSFRGTWVLPIRNNKNIIGFLCLDSIKFSTFNRKERDVLEPLLDTIAKFISIILCRSNL